MTSKNSFLASLLENMKRRIFVIILAALYFCFFFPVGLTVKLNSALAEQEKYPSELFNIKEVALAYLDNEVMIIGVIILAIICAIQGFSYLYSKKKVDFYHSTPISRTKRFSTIYLNGIAIFVIPYIISAILSIFILNIFHAFSWMIVLTILRSFCINLLMFLAIYHVALVAVMMTGHIVVTVLATGVFLGYEFCIRGLWETYANTFFERFCYLTLDKRKSIFCPILDYIRIYENNFGDSSLVIFLIRVVITTCITGILAYLLYCIRPSEASGKTIAFYRTKPYIKFFLMIPISMATAMFFYQLSYDNLGFAVFGLVIGLLLSHYIVEVILEIDVKAFWIRKRVALLAVVATGIIFSIFKWDLTGYDSYLPSKENVESVGVYFNTEDWYQNYYDEEGLYISSIRHVLDHTNITDFDLILELVNQSQMLSEMEGYNGYNKELASDEIEAKALEGENAHYITYTLQYNLKSGKSIYRTYWIDYRKNIDLLNKFYELEDFIQNTNQIFFNTFLNDYVNISATYSDGIKSWNLRQDEMEELIKYYKEDLLDSNFLDYVENYPIGVIQVNYEMPSEYNSNYTLYWEYPIFENYTKVIQCLAEHELISEKLKPEDVKALQINCYTDKYDIELPEQLEWSTNGRYADEFVARITEPERIEQLMDAMIPNILTNYMHLDQYENIENRYTISIIVDELQNREDIIYDANRYVLLKEFIPDFLK